jgi:hypothetical protein
MHTNRNGLVRRGGPAAPVSVPNGEYPARLVDVVAFTNAHGKRLGFSYEIASGPYAGTVLMQSAAHSTAPQGRLAEILRELLAREPTPDELRHGPGRDHLGLSCRVVAVGGRNRAGMTYSAVEKVIR